jgi:hypothetical protein
MGECSDNCRLFRNWRSDRLHAVGRDTAASDKQVMIKHATTPLARLKRRASDRSAPNLHRRPGAVRNGFGLN